MLTTRGWWFLVAAVVSLALGLFAELPALVPLGLALTGWIACVGLGFSLQCRLVARRLEITRVLHDERGPIDALWAGRAVEVEVELRLRGSLSLPFVRIRDRVPFAVEHESGEVETSGRLTHGQPLHLHYRIRPRSPGQARFEGLRLAFSDLQGFFFHETFLTDVVLCRILPVLADSRGRPALTKRHNLLPPPGIHRLCRPGSGSELLDLRDYLPGDPPRTIAWKVSARRDRLITKEFESEVPLTCTLFLDRSHSARLGPPGKTAVTRLVEIAAAVAQANTAVRDLTGLCLFDETSTTIIRPGRSARHLVQTLNLLAETSALAPTTGEARLADLLPLADAFAEEVYPSLLRPELNAVPWLLTWLAPRPSWTAQRPTFGDRLHATLLSSGVVSGIVGLAALAASVVLLISDSLPPVALLTIGLACLIGSLGALGTYFAWQFFLPARRRSMAARKRLAALLSVRHGLAPGGLGALLEDDALMVAHLQRFLGEHQVPYPLPLYDPQGHYLFASPTKIEILARALLQGLGRGRDNELFVVLADLYELADQLGPLLRATKVALARHHQVLIVCPWPPGLPPPTELERLSEDGSPQKSSDRRAGVSVTARRASNLRFQRAYAEVRQAFARLGVAVLCAVDDQPIRLILDHMERLRMVGRKR